MKDWAKFADILTGNAVSLRFYLIFRRFLLGATS